MKPQFDPQTKYGRYRPLRPGERPRTWVCQCDCGTEREVYVYNLTKGVSTSCGCKQKKHGRKNTPEYVIWREMRHRCRNPNHAAYHRSGRGPAVGRPPRVVSDRDWAGIVPAWLLGGRARSEHAHVQRPHHRRPVQVAGAAEFARPHTLDGQAPPGGRLGPPPEGLGAGH